jgi:hypothetical protein
MPLPQVSRHQLPKFILVQPNGIGVSGDEFVNVQAINQLRTGHSLLPAVDEDRHEILISQSPPAFFAFW